MIIGRGSILPMQFTYGNGDNVTATCADGYELQGENVSTCVYGDFYPENFTCVETGEEALVVETFRFKII